MKKKTLIIIVFVVLLIICIVFVKSYYKKQMKERNNKRYEEIKKDVLVEVKRYTNVVHPICKDNDGKNLITHRTLVYNGGFDKEKLLDVDGKSYCSVYALSGCDENEEYTYEIYLKCKNYEDKGFILWDEPFEDKK